MIKRKIFVKRNRENNEGDLSFIEYTRDSDKVNENKSLRNIKIRTGINRPYFLKRDWYRGKSGCPIGTHLLWTKRNYIKQYHDLDATGREVGRFYPISNNIEDHRVIRADYGTQYRLDIGIHDENDFPGSAGCIVVINNKDFRELVKKLEKLERITFIPLTVFLGK